MSRELCDREECIKHEPYKCGCHILDSTAYEYASIQYCETHSQAEAFQKEEESRLAQEERTHEQYRRDERQARRNEADQRYRLGERILDLENSEWRKKMGLS